VILLPVSSNIVPISPILINLMMEATISFFDMSVLQEQYVVSTQKEAFFIITAVKS
jgi:hypothetical protein